MCPDLLPCAGAEAVHEWHTVKTGSGQAAQRAGVVLDTATGPSRCLPALEPRPGSWGLWRRRQEEPEAWGEAKERREAESLLAELGCDVDPMEGTANAPAQRQPGEGLPSLMAHAFRICADAGVCESLDWSKALPEGLREIEQTWGIEAARTELVKVRSLRLLPKPEILSLFRRTLLAQLKLLRWRPLGCEAARGELVLVRSSILLFRRASCRWQHGGLSQWRHRCSGAGRCMPMACWRVLVGGLSCFGPQRLASSVGPKVPARHLELVGNAMTHSGTLRSVRTCLDPSPQLPGDAPIDHAFAQVSPPSNPLPS